MRDRAPKLLLELRKSGQLEKHLQEKSLEAHRLFEELTSGAPKLQSGYPEQPWARQAEEQVFAVMLEFPPENEPGPTQDPLGAVLTEPLPGRITQSRRARLLQAKAAPG
jgi:hypothetical protein